MITLSDVIDKLGVYEDIGFSRDQAIQMIQAEQLIVLNSRLSRLINKVGSPNTDATKKEVIE